jgi:hypothetical protein
MTFRIVFTSLLRRCVIMSSKVLCRLHGCLVFMKYILVSSVLNIATVFAS